MEKIKLFEQNC